MKASPQPALVEADHIALPPRNQSSPPAAPYRRGRYFLVMSGLCLAIALVGFIPTFFAPLALGTFVRPPIYYIHGLFFFGWVIFFFVQTLLIAGGRTLAHREWGVLGAALTTGMVFTVITLDVVEMNHPELKPPGVPGQFIAMVGVTSMAAFCSLVALGLANVGRPEVHKRLMLLATLSLLGAPIERWPLTFLAPHDGSLPPFWMTQIGSVTVGLMIVSAMIYDHRRFGRVSRIYLFGLALQPALLFIGGMFGGSAAWLHAANWIKGIGG